MGRGSSIKSSTTKGGPRPKKRATQLAGGGLIAYWERFDARSTPDTGGYTIVRLKRDLKSLGGHYLSAAGARRGFESLTLLQPYYWQHTPTP